MYNELIEALDLAGKDDSVITVMTGEVLCFILLSVCRSFLTLLSMTLKVTGIITVVETTWTTLQRSLRVDWRRWLNNLGSYWGKVLLYWKLKPVYTPFYFEGCYDVHVCLCCFRRYVNAYIDFPKPLIGVINGPAVGVSVTLLGLFDVVYATERVSCFPSVYQWCMSV